ncbi:unnamed protein product [Clonostachys rosea f. rosea IK726]|uniref:Uncharacterized protein n=1 Tax=Clonostachys rosea f. rosea IK726 TaxID=1349383 RepID=A0ACA9TXD9_BIOOC|nr:unnamed protein product [Clonostachys rosea f. rosea IK726]
MTAKSWQGARSGSCGACTPQGDGADSAIPTFFVENYPVSSSMARLSSDTEAKQEKIETPIKPTTPRSPGRLGSFTDYVSIMATEMSFLENNGFLAAAAVVVVLQETTVQRLLIRQRDPQVRGDAMIRLRRCRDTIKKLRGRQTSLGHRADHLDRVLLEIQKDIQHFDTANPTMEAHLPANTTLGTSPLSCGLLTQATIPDQPSPSLVFDDVINFGNDELELEVGVTAR